ncbi:hypothetical protein BaRGS_00005562, partial [Batillaria attramentaria]
GRWKAKECNGGGGHPLHYGDDVDALHNTAIVAPKKGKRSGGKRLSRIKRDAAPNAKPNLETDGKDRQLTPWSQRRIFLRAELYRSKEEITGPRLLPDTCCLPLFPVVPFPYRSRPVERLAAPNERFLKLD